MESFDNLLKLLFVLVASHGTGLFSALVYFCIGEPAGNLHEGRIFSWVGKYLFTKYKNKTDEHERFNAQMVEDGYEPRTFVNWWKLGICPYCFNVWFTFVSYGVTFWFLGLSVAWLWTLPLAMGYSYRSLGKAL